MAAGAIMDTAQTSPRTIDPSGVRYIKLGKGGCWASEAIADGIVPFGFRQIAHEPCCQGDWQEAARQLTAAGRSPSGVTQGLRELREFYEQDDRCLWITFANGHLWWAFADAEVVAIADPQEHGPRRYRRTLNGWHRASLTGEPLAIRSLSSSLTRVAGYRMTICAVEREDYLLRRIGLTVGWISRSVCRLPNALTEAACHTFVRLRPCLPSSTLLRWGSSPTL